MKRDHTYIKVPYDLKITISEGGLEGEEICLGEYLEVNKINTNNWDVWDSTDPLDSIKIKKGYITRMMYYPSFSNKKSVSIKNIPDLRNLEYLYLSGLEIKDFSNLRKLTKLESLFLCENKIRIIPKSIGKLKELTYLDLQYNKIKNIKILKKLTNLEGLCLSSNPIDNIKVLEKLTNLKRLELPYINDLNMNIIKTIEELSNLKVLFFGEWEISELRESFIEESNLDDESKDILKRIRTSFLNKNIQPM